MRVSKASTCVATTFAIGVFGVGGVASAGPVSGTVSLPGAVAYVFVDTATGDQSFTAPGAYSFQGANVATAYLGADPSVSLNAPTAQADNEAKVTYHIEVVPPGGPPATPPSSNGPTVTVGLTMSDFVSSAGEADANISISGDIGNALPLRMENCANGVLNGCNYYGAFTTTPFSAIHSVDLVPGIPYAVNLFVDIAGPGFASIDPRFTAPSGYTMAYSEGVGGVPEPSAWALMLLGLAAVGGAARSGRRLGAAKA